jgi:permease
MYYSVFYLSARGRRNIMKKSLLTTLSTFALMALLSACVPSSTESTAAKEADSSASSVENSVKQSSESSKSTDANLPKIGVIQLVDHTSLNIIYDAFSKELVELGYKDGENVIVNYKNAQGDMANLPTIVQSFEADKQDVVVAITTPVAQAAMSLTANTPVIFSAVTNPVEAGVVADLNTIDKGMTGTTDAVNVDKIMDLAMTISKDAKTVGYIYNPGEDNSVSNLAALKEYASAHGLTVEEASISGSVDLQSAASSLVDKVDIFFVANDNTVAESMPVLVKVANDAKKPLYVGADSMVMDGGFATVGIDYTDLGKETARMVDQVLKGKKVEEMPVKVFKDDLYTYINTDTAKAIGVEIPESILSDEKFVEIKNKK